MPRKPNSRRRPRSIQAGQEEVIDCWCLWSDLLGFGRYFEEGGWSFSNRKARENVKRLAAIENLIFQSNSPTQEYVFLLNDGLARNMDQPGHASGSLHGVLHWLKSLLTNHWQINATEKEWGFPGMRSVLCSGQRMSLRPSTKSSSADTIASGPLADMLAREVVVYSPQQFQMNLAFSKAYILESLGHKNGLTGPNIFIEEKFFDDLSAMFANDEWSVLDERSNHKEKDAGVDARLTFKIVEKSARNKAARIALELDASTIPAPYRGIDTTLYKITRFQPMDENDDFWFNFPAQFQTPNEP